MQVAPSWRLDVRDSQPCSFALMVRDALQLEVAEDARDVPALLGPVPDLASRLSDCDRRIAAQQWPSWWTQLVTQQLTRPEHVEHPRQLLSALAKVWDPPDFAALSGRAALQRAARVIHPHCRAWERALPRHVPREAVSWQLARQVAEDMSFDLGVDARRLNARILVLPVVGPWWRRTAPGRMLCSVDTLLDTGAMQAALRDAFSSSVAS